MQSRTCIFVDYSTTTCRTRQVRLSNDHVSTHMSVDVNIDSGSDKDWIQDEIINKLKETVRKQVTTDHGAEETNYRSVTELSEGWVLGL